MDTLEVITPENGKPYVQAVVGAFAIRGSHLWNGGAGAIAIVKAQGNARNATCKLDDVQALVDAIHAVEARVATDVLTHASAPAPAPAPASEPDVAAIVQAVMAQLAAREAVNTQRGAEHARHAAAIAAIDGQQ